MTSEKKKLYALPLDRDWRKSSFSAGNGDNCVELMPISGGIAVRDSKNPAHPEIRYASTEFVTFIQAVKAGGFDHQI